MKFIAKLFGVPDLPRPRNSIDNFLAASEQWARKQMEGLPGNQQLGAHVTIFELRSMPVKKLVYQDAVLEDQDGKRRTVRTLVVIDLEKNEISYLPQS